MTTHDDNKQNNNNITPVQDEDDEQLLLEEDDELILLEDDEIIPLLEEDDNSSLQVEPWKIMIVDDDLAVHQATKLALKNFVFDDKPLLVLEAFSASEAKQLISEHSDIAFILLDVVMETNDAGLNVVRYIREELNNKRIQIVLRTGQPGEAPEEYIIRNYEINDYRTKVELTRQRLITSTISALRAYRNVIAVEEKSIELSKTLKTLQQTQLQLIQTEKMSSLGKMIAGIAHEINNPITFISGNINYAREYVRELLELLELYQQNSSVPVAAIEEKLEDLDLEFLSQDLEKLLDSMKTGSDRISKIVLSLRNFSRLDEAQMKQVNIHEGLENTLLILQHRLIANGSYPEITVVKNYGKLVPINCYANQLNQVFMEIFNNAIDILTTSENVGKNPTIFITTEMKDSETVRVSIADNGIGMSKNICQRIFDPFFTTKPVGEGTGLGLSISYQIITEQHKGQLQCISQSGKGTELIIDIPDGSPNIARD
ncbi:MAG: hybrid sensor histidine kinase/response regulator [Okeania sp. SIO3B5]|uniref:ATP-binding protein n=1 Tax=Okeania sp. SIO3B5 TaxID=2607811 RepID=UPI0013FE7341|nr:ATP-binding protein [Okeania sp. SIO3B5]NEO56646.1 hybrid sensor histidine kinase/response regulator [Okeania sp. SIO3B5]